MKTLRRLIEHTCSPTDRPLTSEEFSELRKHLDGIWKHLGIDIDFTKHFVERANDPRNKKQISMCELEKLFTDVAKKYGPLIASKVKPDTEKGFDSVLTDLSTKVNTPVIIEWDKKAKRLRLYAKTVMRVGHFYTHDNQQRLTVEHTEEEMKENKTFQQLREWLGDSGVPTVPSAGWGSQEFPVATDKAPFAIEHDDVLEKLNAYCQEMCQGQYLNPYYPINTLWRKMMLLGINFDVKAVVIKGSLGSVRVPLTQFGGRTGVLGGASYTSSDDGISNRVPGGLVLAVSFTHTNGIYTLNAQIEHGSANVAFGEEAVNEEAINETQQFTHRVYTGPTQVKDIAKRLHKTYPNVSAGTEHVMIHTNHPADHILKSMKNIGSGWKANDVQTKTHPEAKAAGITVKEQALEEKKTFSHEIYTGDNPHKAKDVGSMLHKIYPNTTVAKKHVIVSTDHPAEHVLDSLKNVRTDRGMKFGMNHIQTRTKHVHSAETSKDEMDALIKAHQDRANKYGSAAQMEAETGPSWHDLMSREVKGNKKCSKCGRSAFHDKACPTLKKK